MKKRIAIIIISFISAFVLISGGYSFWSKPLIVTGSIEIRELPLKADEKDKDKNKDADKKTETKKLEAVESESQVNVDEDVSHIEDPSAAPEDSNIQTIENILPVDEEAAAEPSKEGEAIQTTIP